MADGNQAANQAGGAPLSLPSVDSGPAPSAASEPLAQALDETLSKLMDAKIANFAAAFGQMQERLKTQESVLARLKERLQSTSMLKTELDPDIVRAVGRIEAQLGVKLERTDFDALNSQIEALEAEIRDRIELKQQELDDMHGLLENFTALGTGIETARSEYNKARSSKELHRHENH